MERLVVFSRLTWLFHFTPTVHFRFDPQSPPDSHEIGVAIFRGMVGDDVIADIPRKITEGH
jgi:hypothetical protein